MGPILDGSPPQPFPVALRDSTVKSNVLIVQRVGIDTLKSGMTTSNANVHRTRRAKPAD